MIASDIDDHALGHALVVTTGQFATRRNALQSMKEAPTRGRRSGARIRFTLVEMPLKLSVPPRRTSHRNDRVRILDGTTMDTREEPWPGRPRREGSHQDGDIVGVLGEHVTLGVVLVRPPSPSEPLVKRGARPAGGAGQCRRRRRRVSGTVVAVLDAAQASRCVSQGDTARANPLRCLMPRLTQSLPEGPLDIVGDVHGEIRALERLLERLGVGLQRRRAARPLVFVGDLVDRGPDSIAVVELVADLVEAGAAQCVAGNHELNLLTCDQKEGNGWLLGHDDGFHEGGRVVPFDSRRATAREQARILTFLAELPLVLEREDLRVVHACWDSAAHARLPVSGSIAALAAEFNDTIDAKIQAARLRERAAAERAEFAVLRDPNVIPTRHLDAVAAEESIFQLENPIKLLTSGAERPVPPGMHFYAGGRWRFVERERWWHAPIDKPTVVGHYWRRRGEPAPEKADVWDDVPPFAWAGQVYCIDYCVGRRHRERHRGIKDTFAGGLAALRWPERTLAFDDRDDITATTM